MPDLNRPETFQSNGEYWEAQAIERDRQALRDFAADLEKVRRSRRSADQAVALIAALAEMEQVSPRRWEGGSRGPELGPDPGRWPSKIETWRGAGAT